MFELLIPACAVGSVACLGLSLWQKREPDTGLMTRRKAKQLGLFVRSDQAVALGRLDNRWLWHNHDDHVCIIGGTRRGKSQTLLGTLLTWRKSAIIYDPKEEGELFEKSSGWRSKLGKVYRFQPLSLASCRINPLDVVPRDGNARSVLYLILEPLFEHETGHWKAASLDLVVTFCELALAKGRGDFAYVKEMLDDAQTVLASLARSTSSIGTSLARTLSNDGDEHRGAIISTARLALSCWDGNVLNALSESDFRLSDVMCSSKPVTLYLNFPASFSDVMMPLFKVVLAAIRYELLTVKCADMSGRKKRHKCLFVIEEALDLKWNELPNWLALSAGYGFKLVVLGQSKSGFDAVYGRSSDAMFQNLKTRIVLKPSEAEESQWMATQFGTHRDAETSESRTVNWLGIARGERSITTRMVIKPMISPTDLMNWPDYGKCGIFGFERPIVAEAIYAERDLPKRFLRPLRPSKWRGALKRRLIVRRSTAPLTQQDLGELV